MTPNNEIQKRIDEVKDLLQKITDGHMGSEAKHGRVGNHIAIIDLELKVNQIISTDFLSKTIESGVTAFNGSAQAQEKQTKSLIWWTTVMAVAIVIQSVVLGAQVWISWVNAENKVVQQLPYRDQNVSKSVELRQGG